MQFYKHKTSRGFSLVEVMFASAILAVVFAATIGILQYHNIQNRKYMEQAMMLDFAQHYMEIARNQPFYQIIPGQPINELYDGTHNDVEIRFPESTEWQNLWTEDFRNFHPDLEWFENRSPQYKCIIENEIVDDEIRSKHINYFMRWKPPLGKGVAWMEIQFDVVVYPDFK